MPLVVVAGVVVWLSPAGDAAKVRRTDAIEVHQGPVTLPAEFRGDVRELPKAPVRRQAIRPELELLESPVPKVGPDAPAIPAEPPRMPAPSQNFAGLDFANWGAGHPPDTVGDVGASFYVQAVNTSIGIFQKDGTRVAAFTFNSLMAPLVGTPCAANNMGDPTVVYDPMADRYIVADFAWTDIQNGPYYECIAVSQSGDPVSGGWFLYAVRTDDAAHPWLPDYPKMGIWPDGLYMTANMFDCFDSLCSASSYQEVRVYAFDRVALEAGAPLREIFVDFGTNARFSLLPSNMRGTQPPAGRPNLLVDESQTTYTFEVWKFHVDYATPANSTFTGPTSVSQSSYTLAPSSVPSSGSNLDSLRERLMMQNQYRNIGGTESLWVNHTVGTSGVAAIQWAQIDVSGGTVSTTPVQQQIYGNVGADGIHRWMGNLAVDSQGNMALGYSASKAGMNPDIRYSGRLASDPLNTLAQGEATLQTGGGSQVGYSRWGDYSAMSVDPVDDCTFWYTNEYFATTGADWQTRIGSFSFPGCIPTASADLEVAKTGPATSATGSNVSYTITVTNHGPDSADSVSLTDDVPAGSTFVSASQTSGPTFGCTTPAVGGTGTITCTLSPMASGAVAKFKVVVHPTAGTTSMTNTADVSSTTSDPGPSPNSASVTTTIAAPPDTTIDSNPSDPSNSPDASFTFSASTSSTFECKLDAGSFAACTSPKGYTGLADGPHTFAVRATDGLGQTDASPASFTWTIDTAPPDTFIDSHPTDPTTSTTASFDFSSDDGLASFECNLDSAGFTACTSPKSYSGLSLGDHTFAVRAKDAAGNTDSSPATFGWTIQSAPPPDTTIDSHPADPSASADASFTFSATTSSTFECKLDGGSFGACASPKDYTGLADGSHTFQVRATDTLAQTDPSPASFTWTIDTTGPQTAIDSHPANPTTSTSATFTFSANEAATFECSLDGAAFAACTSPKTYSSLAKRSHRFRVRATDTAGHTDATPAEFDWTNGKVPTVTITGKPPATTSSTTAVLTFTSTDAGATFMCSLDGAAFAPCTSPATYPGLAAGAHGFAVEAVDAADRVSAPAKAKWTIGTASVLSLEIVDHPPTIATSAQASFTLRASDPGAKLKCSLDGAAYAPCGSIVSYRRLGHGPHTFRAKATDAAGNKATATWSWTIRP